MHSSPNIRQRIVFDLSIIVAVRLAILDSDHTKTIWSVFCAMSEQFRAKWAEI